MGKFSRKKKNLPMEPTLLKRLLPEDGELALVGSDALLKGVRTSAPCAVFASGPELQPGLGRQTMEFLQEACGFRSWFKHKVCQQPEGGAGLQFRAGQAWVPETQGSVCAHSSYHLPAIFIPTPGG